MSLYKATPCPIAAAGETVEIRLQGRESKPSETRLDRRLACSLMSSGVVRLTRHGAFDKTYQVNLVRGKLGLWAGVYTVAGAVACFVNLTQAKPHDVQRFFVYLLCANAAALGLKLMAGQSLLPAAFLVLLLGVEELSLPELL